MQSRVCENKEKQTLTKSVSDEERKRDGRSGLRGLVRITIGSLSAAKSRRKTKRKPNVAERKLWRHGSQRTIRRMARNEPSARVGTNHQATPPPHAAPY